MQASWDDAVHLTEDAKLSLFSSLPAYQRDARSKGIPQLGAGAIFQVSEDQFVVPPIKGGIPATWAKASALDVGFRVTAAGWLTRDPDTDIYYVYADYDREDSPYSIHAEAIKAKGAWIPCACDPAANQRGQADGQRLMDNYRKAGLILVEAENSVSSGIEDVLDALIGGRLKIVDTCQKLIRQMRVYRRDDKGRIVKKNDHLCDVLRYLWVTGRTIMKCRPVPAASSRGSVPSSPRSWMA